jgi:polyisoprenyl-phosphate glycosyltransferase
MHEKIIDNQNSIIKKKSVDYTIVVPVYCNEGSLMNLYKEIYKNVVMYNKSKSYEIIFVDDGSTDLSFDVLLGIKQQDNENVSIIKFTRNFGQLSAVIAGYNHAVGDCIINISADLQDPPHLINNMLDAFYNEQYEIVINYREARDESIFRKSTSAVFYWLMKKLSFPDMPSGGFDFVLISRKVKEQILKINEANPFFQGQVLWTGFKKKYISYKREARKTGESKFSFSKKIKYLIDGVMAYSYLPLRLMTVIGILVSILGFFYAITIFLFKIFGKMPIEGWAPLMITVLMLSGIQMVMLGVIGEYLWRVLDQVRGRPLYIIDKILK